VQPSIVLYLRTVQDPAHGARAAGADLFEPCT